MKRFLFAAAVVAAAAPALAADVGVSVSVGQPGSMAASTSPPFRGRN
jgi:hypothetical protein